MTRQLKITQAQESRKAYEENQRKFQKPPVTASTTASTAASPSKPPPNPAYTSSKRYSSTVNYHDVYERRRAYYRDWNPPVVIYHSAPYYGSWDSTFLWWALWHDSAFGYHHYDSPDYQAWHADAVRLASENSELRQQLAKHDADIAALRQQNVAVNTSYIPAPATNDPTIALSDDTIKQLPVRKPILRVATGIPGGHYEEIGRKLRERTPKNFLVELIPSAGAAQNWELLKEGKVDAAIVQSDVETADASEIHAATVYSEYVMLIVSKDSSIAAVKDLGKESTIYVGPPGSGTELTWRSFVNHDSAYKNIRVVNADYSKAIEKIESDRHSAMMFVAGADAPLLKKVAKTGKFKLIPVDDVDFAKVTTANGQPVYDSLLITKDAYPGLQNRELRTLSVDALWTLNNNWVEKYGEAAFDEVNYAVMEVISDLHIGSLKAKPPHSGHTLLIALVLVLGIGYLEYIVTKVNITGS